MYNPSGPPEAPTNVQVTSVTAVRATVSWQSGLDGGHPQTFRVLLRPITSFSQIEDYITDPGYNLFLNHTLTDLESETQYEIKVLAINEKGQSISEVVDFTTVGVYSMDLAIVGE